MTRPTMSQLVSYIIRSVHVKRTLIYSNWIISKYMPDPLQSNANPTLQLEHWAFKVNTKYTCEDKS